MRTFISFPIVFIMLSCFCYSAEYKNEKDINQLIQDLKSTQNDVILNAASSLAEMGKDANEAVPSLVEVLKTSNPVACTWITVTLGKIGNGSDDVLNTLFEKLHSDDEKCALSSVVALGYFTDKASIIVPEFNKLLFDSPTMVRFASLNILAKFGTDAKHAMPGLLHSLKDEDPQISISSVAVLSIIGPDSREAIPQLTKLMSSDQFGTRLVAAFALVRIGSITDDVFSILFDALKNENSSYRNLALESLHTAGSDSINKLISLLNDNSPETRSFAATALGRLGSDSTTAVPALEKALDDKEKIVRIGAAWALDMIKPDAGKPMDVLLNVLKKEGWHIDDKVSGILKNLGINPDNKDIVQLIIGITVGKDWGAGIGDGRFRDIFPSGNENADSLISTLKNKNADTLERARAAKMLGWFSQDPEKVIPTLLWALEDDDPNVRYGAVLAVWKIKPEPKSIIPSLEKRLGDNIDEIAGFSTVLLHSYGQEGLLVLLNSLKNQDTRTRRFASQGIGMFGKDAASASKNLVVLLQDNDMRVRISAAESLKKIDADFSPAVPVLLEIVNGNNADDIRIEAAGVLSQLAPDRKEPEKTLNDLLKSDNNEIRSKACEALGNIKPVEKTTISSLILALKDADRKVRLSAAIALGNFGPDAKDSVPALTEALNDVDQWVRQKARLSLDLITTEE